jgi:hypothetical protein
MPIRWSKTAGGYNKYRYIFTKALPQEIECPSPISKASIIRDVIKYAHDHHLPGQDWYGHVVVTPEEGKVIIRKRNPKAEVTLDYPFAPLMVLLANIQKDIIKPGFKFTSDKSAKELNSILNPLGLHVKDKTLYLELEAL